MRTGPIGKGPRLWLQPGRDRGSGATKSIWVIRDGSTKRSTGFPADQARQAEQALAEYIAEKHRPETWNGDPTQVLIADVLALYVQNIVPRHSRPKDSESRVRRLVRWWCDPDAAEADMRKHQVTHQPMTGAVADIRTATCNAYRAFVGAERSGRIDLEILRAALNHAFSERLLDRQVPVPLPPKSLPRERWLTRSEVARLVWAAWRYRRSGNGRSGQPDNWASRQHLARWLLVAAYTGTRKTAILNASFERQFGRGYVDLEAGVWHRRGAGVRATKKRQPAIPIPQRLLAHMRRWRRNGQKFLIEYQGEPVQRLDIAFRRLVADAKLPGETVVPHTLRHTAITWAMINGMDAYAASGFFGLNLQTLLENYGHHHPSHLRAEAEIMSRTRVATGWRQG